MKHDLHIRGFAFGLRPITLADAEFIVKLRSDTQRCRFLHPIPLSVGAQRAYLEQYFQRDKDYYFVVEREPDGAQEGLIGIYNFDARERAADWGRWILRPGSLASVESALRIYETAFEYLGLERVCSHTILENRSVVSFHDRCSLSGRVIRQGYYTMSERTYDVVEHVLNRGDWPRVRQFLESKAKLIARRIRQS